MKNRSHADTIENVLLYGNCTPQGADVEKTLRRRGAAACFKQHLLQGKSFRHALSAPGLHWREETSPQDTLFPAPMESGRVFEDHRLLVNVEKQPP